MSDIASNASLTSEFHTHPQFSLNQSRSLPHEIGKELPVARQLEKLKTTIKSLRNELRQKEHILQKFAEEIMLLEIKERTRIARLLHNDLQQQLFIISLSMHTLQQDLGDNLPESIKEEFDTIFSYVESAGKTTRELAVSLHVPHFKNNSIYEAMNWLDTQVSQQYKMELSIDIEKNITIPDYDLLLQIIQIIRELLFNVVKHAGCHTAKIEIFKSESMIWLRVKDKGAGFNTNTLKSSGRSIGSLGLRSFIHLIPANDGKIDIESEPGKGTTVTVAVKVTDNE